jgi:hypothetical protein
MVTFSKMGSSVILDYPTPIGQSMREIVRVSLSRTCVWTIQISETWTVQKLVQTDKIQTALTWDCPLHCNITPHWIGPSKMLKTCQDVEYFFLSPFYFSLFKIKILTNNLKIQNTQNYSHLYHIQIFYWKKKPFKNY